MRGHRREKGARGDRKGGDRAKRRDGRRGREKELDRGNEKKCGRKRRGDREEIVKIIREYKGREGRRDGKKRE